jgi:hypothetical protein
VEVIRRPISDGELSELTGLIPLTRAWYCLFFCLQMCDIPGLIYHYEELGNRVVLTVVDALILTIAFSAGCAWR